MALLQHAVAVAREYLWGFPMLALLFGTHLYFTFHLGFIQKKIPLGIRLSLTGTKNQEKDQLPHTWNAVDGQDGGNDYYRGTCKYVRHFAKPEL